MNYEIAASAYTSAREGVERELELMETMEIFSSTPKFKRSYVKAKWKKAMYVACCQSIIPLLSNSLCHGMASLTRLQFSLALLFISEEGDLRDQLIVRIREQLRLLREEAENHGVTPDLYEIEDYLSPEVQGIVKRELNSA
ncbi:MAG: hypothetical protein LBH53_03485 [Puniceicoccales bacterium]|jgi:hypothetical protein|nr:hypothetical protein [Puniceicoccales bacterium]